NGIKLEMPFVERGNILRGIVRLRGEIANGAKLRLDLVDSYGRTVRRQFHKLASGDRLVQFNMPIGDESTILMRLWATLVDRYGDVDTAEVSFKVPDRRRGHFNMIMWDCPLHVLGYYAFRKLRDVGFSVCLRGGNPTPIMAACDFAQIPYTTRILDRYDERGYMKPVCWNDARVAKQYVQSIVEKYVPSRQHGVFVYSLGDETTTKGCCLHPACMDAYRRYLKRQYGTIEALNAEWGTHFKSFDEINISAPGDNYEQTALRNGQYARWFDRQAFARYNFARFCKQFVRAYERIDPQAITGFEGAGRFGDDFDTIIRTNGFWSPYPSIADEIIRSLAPREFIRANWMGYQKTADPLVAYAWRMICNDTDSIWWWRWDGIGRFHGFLRPTFDLWAATQELVNELRIVRDGLGDWRLHAEMLNDGVAVLYSMPSYFANQLDNSSKFVNIIAAHEAFVNATRDNGIGFKYITPRLLRANVLLREHYRVLILPFTQALGDADVAAIQQFVRRGGLLICDLRPGIYTDHCKPRERAVLDELLGVRHKRLGEPKTASIKLNCTLAGQSITFELPNTVVDASLRVTTGYALATVNGVPVMITRRIGDGRTVLFNFHIATYTQQRMQGVADEMRKLLKTLYAIAGVKPRVEVTTSVGAPARGVEKRFWRAGDALVMALWRNPFPWRWSDEDLKRMHKERLIVTLNHKAYVYDMHTPRYIGRVRRWHVRLPLGRARFFAILPYRIDGVDVDVIPRRTMRAKRILVYARIRVSRQMRAPHAIVIQLYDSRRNKLRWGRRIILTHNGVGQTTFYISHTDSPGKWLVRAQELFSQRRATAEFVVR
ncbi:MAG TPA: hypothetical protein EYP10_11585, partial [Armatimonadetes bacterium]|nr:hypothetical protein [Armatimonadota bacterium]